MSCQESPRQRFGACLPLICTLVLILASSIHGQIKSPSEEIRDLKRRLDELQDKVEQLGEEGDAKDKRKKKKDQDLFAGGLLTLGGLQLRLGGKAEILLIDSQNERDPVVGSTDNPDPHLELNKLRIAPQIRFNRNIDLRSQIDFRPRGSRVTLKELWARHKWRANWWFRTEEKLGIEDRFIRPQRRTKNYPIMGTAFWRDETIGINWMMRFGDKDGKPKKKSKKKKRAGGDSADVAVLDNDGERVLMNITQAGPGGGTLYGPKESKADPFDFKRNFGEFRTYLYAGNSPTLDFRSTNFDRASFNDVVQDDRQFDVDQALRNVGVGLGYRRSFSWLGELGLLGFYYEDKLSDTSAGFLRSALTVRDPVTGAPVSGYGDSNLRTADRWGFGGEYFLPAKLYMPSDWNARRGDGLRIAGQWLKARDGSWGRTGWYVQASYRYSFPQRLLFDRYFRSIEPIFRYGEYEGDIDPVPLLPGLWDRRRLLVGGRVEIIREIFLLVEYTFNWETTGASSAPAVGPSSVANNELMLELLLRF